MRLSSISLMALILISACGHRERHVTLTEGQAAAIACEKHPARTVLPTAEAKPETAYVCDDGGILECAVERCGYYLALKKDSARKWRYIRRGEMTDLSPGVGVFVHAHPGKEDRR